jgi:hypothetical protein
MEWLRKYGITNKEILQNGIGHSNSGVFLVSRSITLAPLLVLPIWERASTLLLWQGRYMGEDRKYPRYYTVGLTDSVLPIYGYHSDLSVVAVCEDILSAIKISRVCSSMPLLGSFLSKEKAIRLSKLYKGLIFWLDYDKADVAIKLADQYKPFFENVNVVVTEKDPKEYSTEEIQKCLHL